ncbi:uncharacterized protein LOC118447091 isoform X1 [Vespa mandarinia]|uniref:uncharacterized protein LOC118447091 isoform X1 n=1 Tax=Vespa mandarinia TaxID=7446 RepID=UPI0016132653|nr:uncharacterized protein LOC118447091 isoform X1 [Vespa mandarinia]XP_035734478.1 uncharacterized protein LOC118447091 isoform X1 [Vespa mandarinia]
MRITSCYFKRLIIIALIIAVIFCIGQVLRSVPGFNDDLSNYDKLVHMSQLIKESVEQDTLYLGNGIPACKLPELKVSNPEIMKFIHNVPPIICTPEDWVKVDKTRLIIDKEIKNKYGRLMCTFSEVIRIDDFNIKYSEPVEADDFYIPRYSDFVDVKCTSESNKKWHSVLAGVKLDFEIKRKYSWDNVPNNSLKLNVLMFGFDSLSRNTFIRKLPKTYQYLKHNLNTLVLEGYNIVGDGTPQALIPILTGKIELELPETRKRMGQKAQFVNIYPMVWKEYKEKGYITGFMEDVHHIGTFTYRLKGFKEQPTNHYMRTFYLAAERYFRNYNKFCMGSIPRHVVMLNYIKAIFDTYKDEPKFVFGFHGELSHDSYNDIGAADEDLYLWVKQLQDSGHLNNTILILMSDHGHRFAEIRNTLQGKQEERLPFFSFTFPPWFKKVHSRAYENFLHNTKHLTTPFDIHKTLQAILNFESPKEGDRYQRAINLFDKIPLERTCADAFIEPHWCACLSWKEIEVDNPNVIAAAKFFVQFLNTYTEEHRDICETLKINQILWSAKLLPTKGLLNFQKSGDQDGFVADLSAKTKLTSEIYQIKVKTEPGGGLFEASITYNVNKNIFNTKISDVSRINKYGSQASKVRRIIMRRSQLIYLYIIFVDWIKRKKKRMEV